jgi:prevent-host-death family protein
MSQIDKNTITTTELKARCSEIVNRVARTRTPVELTKRGRRIARIVPADDAAAVDLFGFARGSVTLLGDIVAPIDVDWEAAE